MLVGVPLERLAELRVRNANECASAFGDRPPPKFSDAMFGDDVVDGVLHRGDGCAGTETGHDPRGHCCIGRGSRQAVRVLG